MLRTFAIASVLLVVGAGAAYAQPSARPAQQPGPVSWTTYHDNPAGTGIDPRTSAIDTNAPSWVSPSLDGQLYGEPLVDGDRIYVATEDNTVYALSASNGTVAWSAHLGRPVPAGALPCGDISPTVGITGTPVIDTSRGEIFAVADLYVNGKSAHTLFGLSLATGKVELRQDVDPPGADTAALLQRTGLALDAGQVVSGMGGNYGDCAAYRGRVIAVPEGGGTPRIFTVDAAPGDSQGAVWMGGAAPVIDSEGHVWVTTGNGSVYSAAHPYDDSDAVLELSSSLKLLQYFAPGDWPANNSRDLDMSTAPMLLPSGQVVLAGKSRIVYLLNAGHLGGIGGAGGLEATLSGRTQPGGMGTVCANDIDGGAAVAGMTVYLPCTSGIEAVRATASPPALHLLWSSGVGGGPPIVAGGLVWTIGLSGVLYGLSPATGKVARQVTIGIPANHFPTPSVGDGLMLATCASNVIAFAAPAGSVSHAASPGRAGCAAYAAPGPGIPRRVIAVFALIGLLVAAGLAWLLWLIVRGRRARRRPRPTVGR
ncbi:MAG: PQQ-binding-like beta-propeller repeat protein [Trebonia sp.]